MTNDTILVGIMGASGRMGRMLIKAVLENPRTQLVGAYDRADSTLIGVDAGELIGEARCGVALSALGASMARPDVLIDFSLPSALSQTVEFCQNNGTALVMGVTGLQAAQEDSLRALSAVVPVVYAGNYSTGVNLSLNLLATTAKTLGLSADVEIIEAHHKHKLDAPSGTALMMAKAVMDARNQSMDVIVNGRSGSAKRQEGEIGMHALRGGEIVGEHTVQFIMNGEIIEITHKAASRSTFADGALRAAIWVCAKPCGLYDMQDVLNLKA